MCVILVEDVCSCDARDWGFSRLRDDLLGDIH